MDEGKGLLRKRRLSKQNLLASTSKKGYRRLSDASSHDSGTESLGNSLSAAEFETEMKRMEKQKKSMESTKMISFELLLVSFVIFCCVYYFLYMENVLFHITRGYAHLGHTEAKHKIGKHYYEGYGVDQNQSHAMHWFKQAADEGHPEAMYHLAKGHIDGHTTLSKGEAHKLMHHAAAKGVEHALHSLNHVCTDRGRCD